MVQTRATLQAGAPKLWLQVDEEAARLAGMSLTDVASRLAGALDGRLGGTVLEGTESIPVRVRLAEPLRQDPDALLNVPLSLTGTGQQGAANLTLRALATPELLPSWGRSAVGMVSGSMCWRPIWRSAYCRKPCWSR